MAIHFKMVPKKNMQTSPPEVKYYPCAVSQGKVDLDDLARRVAMQSTMSVADCYGVIVGLAKVIAEELTDGNIVDIAHLGTLKLTLQGTAADTQEELGKSSITKVKVIYKPSAKLMDRLREITFKRIR